MRVLYDHQIFSRAGYGGISKYFIELLRHLGGYDDFSYELLSKFSNNENLIESGLGNSSTFFKQRNFRGKGKLMGRINDVVTKYRLRRDSFDIFHPTYYNTYFLSRLPKSRPFVVTCYDLIHEKFGDRYPVLRKDNPGGKKEILERSTAIIAISQRTKEDIIEYYGIEAGKIQVIYLGHDQQYTDRETAGIVLPNNYFLFIGMRQGYKNFDFFIESVSGIVKKYPDLHIVCAGGGQFSVEELMLFQKFGISEKVVYHTINEQTLPAIYSGARAFFYPSLYEGFGIPVLEAFANDCPAILSNQGSLPEVGDGAALYFDPYVKESLTEAAQTILNNEEKRAELIEKGRRRLGFFSWEETARQTFNLYKSVL